jgi:hypothetical protein
MWVASALGISAGGAILGAGALGAGASIWGANKASQTQLAAAQMASQLQSEMFQQGAGAVGQAQGGFSPFTTLGGQTSATLGMMMPSLTASFNPTMKQLENTPGYQFTLGQGLKATTNANSAMGLADSGVQGKGIANYAEGLAGTTFEQQFQNYLQQKQQQYNLLMGPTQLGAQAQGQVLGGAESLMGGGINTGGMIGSNLLGGANASAAATMTGANAIGGLGSNAMNQYMQYMLLSRLGTGGVNNANIFSDPGGPVP